MVVEAAVVEARLEEAAAAVVEARLEEEASVVDARARRHRGHHAHRAVRGASP